MKYFITDPVADGDQFCFWVLLYFFLFSYKFLGNFENEESCVHQNLGNNHEDHTLIRCYFIGNSCPRGSPKFQKNYTILQVQYICV